MYLFEQEGPAAAWGKAGLSTFRGLRGGARERQVVPQNLLLPAC